MCALQTGKGRSILRCVRLLFAVAAAACLSHSAMAQVREPATLPPGFPADDDHVYISESALREDLVFCRQSAGQSVAEAPGVPQPTQSASAFDPQTDATQLDHRDRIFYPGDTERLKPLGRKLLLNILLDQKEIFTSPFHMNRHNPPIWLLSASAIGGLIAADHRIANSFENSRGASPLGRTDLQHRRLLHAGSARRRLLRIRRLERSCQSARNRRAGNGGLARLPHCGRRLEGGGAP